MNHVINYHKTNYFIFTEIANEMLMSIEEVHESVSSRLELSKMRLNILKYKFKGNTMNK